MENKTLAKLYLQARKEGSQSFEYAEQILAIEGFNENVDGEIVTHDRIWAGRLDDEMKYLSNKKLCKSFTKDMLMKKIEVVNDIYNHVSSEIKPVMKKAVGKCYCLVAEYMKPYKKNVETLSSLLNLALDNDISTLNLKDFNEKYYYFIDEETRERFNIKHSKEINDLNIKELESVLPEYKYEGFVEVATYAPSVHNAIGVIKGTNDKDFLLELFKNKLSKKSGVTEEAMQSFRNPDAKIETELFYYPVVLLKWHREPNHYHYNYKKEYASVTRRYEGTFDFGGGDGVSFESVGPHDAINDLESLVKDCVTLDADRKELDVDGTYIVADVDNSSGKRYAIPNNCIISERDAKAAIARELGVDNDYSLSISVINNSSAIYEPMALVYVPVLAIKISYNGYVAKGVMNTVDTSKIKVKTVGHIDENGKLTYLTNRDVKSPKKYKTSHRKSIISMLVLILSIIGLGLCGYKSFSQGHMELVPQIIAVSPGILGLVLSIVGTLKYHKKVGKFCTALAFICFIGSLVIAFVFLSGGGDSSSMSGGEFEALNVIKESL